MFWNNQVGQEKEKEKRKKCEREKKKREKNVYSLNEENDCPFYLTPCRRDRKSNIDQMLCWDYYYIFLFI